MKNETLVRSEGITMSNHSPSYSYIGCPSWYLKYTVMIFYVQQTQRNRENEKMWHWGSILAKKKQPILHIFLHLIVS